MAPGDMGFVRHRLEAVQCAKHAWCERRTNSGDESGSAQSSRIVGSEGGMNTESNTLSKDEI